MFKDLFILGLATTVLAQNGQCYKANKPKPIAYLSNSGSVKESYTSKFAGEQRGIGSFFHSNKGSDDTNGQAWCGYAYKDYSNGFAADLRQLTDGTLAKYGHPQWGYYASEVCGQEAIVTNLDNGKSLRMYIIDAFDPNWVKSPGSIDIMANAWKELSGGAEFDKNHVLNVKWYLTGKKSEKYCYGCSGDP